MTTAHGCRRRWCENVLTLFQFYVLLSSFSCSFMEGSLREVCGCSLYKARLAEGRFNLRLLRTRWIILLILCLVSRARLKRLILFAKASHFVIPSGVGDGPIQDIAHGTARGGRHSSSHFVRDVSGRCRGIRFRFPQFHIEGAATSHIQFVGARVEGRRQLVRSRTVQANTPVIENIVFEKTKTCRLRKCLWRSFVGFPVWCRRVQPFNMRQPAPMTTKPTNTSNARKEINGNQDTSAPFLLAAMTCKWKCRGIIGLHLVSVKIHVRLTWRLHGSYINKVGRLRLHFWSRPQRTKNGVIAYLSSTLLSTNKEWRNVNIIQGLHHTLPTEQNQIDTS